MRISGDWIFGPNVQAVCKILVEGGHQVFLVGGCVRNSLIGADISDIDISTDALPVRVRQLCESSGLRVVPTGMEHGTMTVISGGIPFEVTTFRRDVDTDGRRAVVAFSTRIEEDAARRDFTMNALYATPDGQVIDPLGGLPDLLARRLIFVGDARARIREDYLRILRFFRFHAWYGDPSQGLDAEGLAACAELADGIDLLSRERVGSEIKKLLSAPDPAPAVAAMARSGVLSRAIPGADDRALAPLVHLEAGRSPDWRRRLAALGGEDLTDRLRLSRSDAAYLGDMRRALESGEAPLALGYRFGADLAGDAVLVRAALIGSAISDDWQADIARGAAAVFPLKAADLMPKLQGPALGAHLDDLKEAWIASEFALTKDQLLG
jgi:poly(A) polymerase